MHISIADARQLAESFAITNGDLIVAMRKGAAITEGLAFDPDGEATTDPDAALKGTE